MFSAGVVDGTTLESKHAFVFVKVIPHEMLSRNGLDIMCEVTVSVVDAIIGCKLTIPTIYGASLVFLPYFFCSSKPTPDVLVSYSRCCLALLSPYVTLLGHSNVTLPLLLLRVTPMPRASLMP